MQSAERKALQGTVFVILLGSVFAVVGSDSSRTLGGVPIFAICVGLAFVVQWLAFVPAFVGQSEKYFDLVGGLTYVVTAVVVFVSSGKFDLRSVILFLMVLIWAIRLAIFLFRRILRSGRDARFDTLKQSLPLFLASWTLQGLWVTFTSAAVWAAISSSEVMPFDLWLVAGTLVWGVGLGIESVADWQKMRFSRRGRNGRRFIKEGLWAYSRHPNYFGEIVLWIGSAMAALPVLQGWQMLTLSSPFLVAILLIRVSGIPLLERRADEKWGGDEEYQRYKRETPVLFPRIRSPRSYS